MVNISNSKKLLKRAKKIMPHQTGTFSRAASANVEGVYPTYAEEGNGSHFRDVDGNDYVDYLCGLGPITLGYNYKKVNDAIINQLKKGILFSLPSKVEIELSELISNSIPNAEMVKFEKSGSNAVTAAVRAARFLTKRDKVAYCGSGGVWHDWQAAMVSRDGGVPSFNRELISVFEYNDIEGLEQIFEDNPEKIGAIVLEPTTYQKPTKQFLSKVRKIADQNGAILILDEIVTGFRFDFQGAQKYFGIKGDMVCFGKGMGNGLPISAITGKTEFMKSFDKLWVSSTNNSEALSLAGSKVVIEEMVEKKTIPYCWNIGNNLFNGWNKIAEDYGINAKLIGYPIRMKLECYDSKNNYSNSLKSLILQEMLNYGNFISHGPMFISYSHTEEDIKFTLNSFEKTCKKINSIKDEDFIKYLDGKLPQTIWTMKISPTRKNQ